MSSDHEVHFDRELVYVLSTMREEEREAIVNNNTKSEDTAEDNETEQVFNIEEDFRPKKLRVKAPRTKVTEGPLRLDKEDAKEEKKNEKNMEERKEKVEIRMRKCSKCNERMPW